MSMDELLLIVGWGDDLFWAFAARESGSGSAVWIDEWTQSYRSTCVCRTRQIVRSRYWQSVPVNG
jgi:hypothetical protein